MHTSQKRKSSEAALRRNRNKTGLIYHTISRTGDSQVAAPVTQNHRVREWNIRPDHVSTHNYALPLPQALSADDETPLPWFSSLFPEDALPQHAEWFQGDFDPSSGQFDLDDSVFNSTKRNRTRSVSTLSNIHQPKLL